jgi:asparagine synthetase B (glutamine-hydrolysing)
LGGAPSAPVTCAGVNGITAVLLGRLFDTPGIPRELSAGVRSEAELVGRAYRRMGVGALNGLRGQFAVVLWDDERRKGLCASDLLAMQALFLRRGVGWLAFAGELHDLLDLLPSRPGPDQGLFAHWLGSGGAVPSGGTLFEGVTRLRPGQMVELQRDSATTRRYWTPAYGGTAKGSRADHADGLREAIERAVRRRMLGTSTAVVLSGGLDSSIVAATASRVMSPDGTLRTYSALFPDYPELDEGWKVRSLTSSLGIDPAAFELEPHGALWLGLQYAKRCGLPLVGAGAVIDMAIVAEAARDGADVVLDGQTGDETLGFAPFLVSDRLRRGRLLAAVELSRRWPLGRPTTRKEKIFILKHLGLKGALPHGFEDRRTRQGPQWLVPRVRRLYKAMEDPWAWKTAARGPRWWRYLTDFLVDMPHRIFRLDYLRHRAAAVDAVSESPLYDFDLVDYCLRLPPELAFSRDFTRPLAREAMRDVTRMTSG